MRINEGEPFPDRLDLMHLSNGLVYVFWSAWLPCFTALPRLSSNLWTPCLAIASQGRAALLEKRCSGLSSTNSYVLQGGSQCAMCTEVKTSYSTGSRVLWSMRT